MAMTPDHRSDVLKRTIGKPKSHFIQGAIKRPGAFSAKAKAAGMSTQAYAEKEKHAPGRLGDEARFDLVLSKVRPK